MTTMILIIDFEVDEAPDVFDSPYPISLPFRHLMFELSGCASQPFHGSHQDIKHG
jgi:hypothetical protein